MKPTKARKGLTPPPSSPVAISKNLTNLTRSLHKTGFMKREAKNDDKTKCIVAAGMFLGLFLSPAAGGQMEVELNKILNLMQLHDQWQDRYLVEYQVRRTFHAENPRFRQESTLEVQTRFRSPNAFESEVVGGQGSQLIRERVFDKILEAERDANSQQTKQEVRITPANYQFTLIGKQDCGGRPCYNLSIRPKQKNKYSLSGQIWVDAEDGAIVRLLGSPAVRPSLWTLNTEIERQYKRIDGVWLCVEMKSTSNILIAGRSTLKIKYDYLKIQTGGNAL